ncbi:MAG: DUF3052 domain-containing protein [Gaiellaceae bacterium]
MGGSEQHGYSGKPLAVKLGVRAGDVLALLDAPDHALALLAPLPEGVEVRSDVRRRPDVALAFFMRANRLRSRVPALRRAIFPERMLWVAWPKRSSGVATDITEDVVRRFALEHGLVDTKVAAIDETWSGLKLVVPLAQRDGPP